MGLFTGIKDAKVGFGRGYEKNGMYLQRIDRVKQGKTRRGREFLAIEKTVIKVIDDFEGTGHREGEEITHMLMTDSDYFLANFKEFIATCFDADPQAAEVDESDCEAAVSEQQPLAGIVLEMFNKDIQTKDGKPFTKVGYKRRVPQAEIVEVIDPENLAKFFPNGLVDDD